MNLTDLSDGARLYVLGHVRGDRARADALCAVIFLRESVRSVAGRHAISPGSLHRQVRLLRRDLRRLLRAEGTKAMLASESARRGRA